MNRYVLYMHKNKINGKMYVGITSQNPIRRWSNGKGYTGQPKFYKAILKYGWDNFKHEIIFTNLSQIEACNKEQEFIKKYNTIKNGYNVSIGGKASNCRISKLDLIGVCPTCSKDFKRKYKKQTYCSKQCQWNSMKQKRETRYCNYCGKSFPLKRTISKDYKGLFCSHECQIKSMRKTG